MKTPFLRTQPAIAIVFLDLGKRFQMMFLVIAIGVDTTENGAAMTFYRRTLGAHSALGLVVEVHRSAGRSTRQLPRDRARG